ncbi:hypothetical protein IJ674_00755 [bacterium]|nr:hypothetical protein [bacterium]
MKRIVLGLLVFSFTFMPAFSQEFDINSFFVAQNGVFKYHIPDEEDEQTEEQSQNLKTDEVTVKEDIVSDDVTADTSGISKYDSDQEISNEDDYELEDMYGYVLHGYAEYFDDEENAISLDLPENEYLVLNIKKPVAIEGKYFGYLQSSPSLFDNNYTKYNGSEYSISPVSGSSSKSVGGFSAGATYSQGIDYGELEQSSGIFTKYQYKRFAISTSYAKTVNTTNNTYNDNFYIMPELKLSQYFTIKNILSADTVKKRKKAEVVLSVNPFGNKDYDRLRLEFGASGTYDEVNNAFKNQLKFSTMYKF